MEEGSVDGEEARLYIPPEEEEEEEEEEDASSPFFGERGRPSPWAVRMRS